MTEKKQQFTFDKGITNVPSDAICSDNALAESIGMVYDNGEHRVIQKPAEFITSAVGIDGTTPISATILYVHKFKKRERFIASIGTSGEGGAVNFLIVYGEKEGTVFKQKGGLSLGTYSLAYDESTRISTIGKTLIISDKNGMHYYLWTYDSTDYPIYSYLGDSFPRPEVSFRLKEREEVKEELATTGVIGYDNIYRIALNKQEDWNNVVIGLYSKIRKKINQKKRFNGSFCVRAALELYDGSFYHISNPVFIIDHFSAWGVARINGTGGYNDSHTVTMSLFGQRLEYMFFQDYTKWADIIKNVTLFVTKEAQLFDTSVDAILVPGSWNVQSTTPISYYLSENEVQKDPTTLGSPITSEGELYRVLESFPDSDLDDILKEGVYYELCEIGLIGDGEWHDAGDHFDTHTLENITTQTQLGDDDYYSHCPLKADMLYSYNSRLNLAGVLRGFFDGFDFFMPFVTPFGGNPNDESTYTFLVTIRTDEGDITVSHKKQTDQIQGIYFYYPDSRAIHVVILKDNAQILNEDLTEHPTLNGAYYFAGISPTMTEPTFASGDEPSVTEERFEALPNYVIQSEVNNPFIYKAAGYFQVGTGEIIGMSTITQALSEGQFGQYPLLIFSDSGIWALSVASTGYYDSIHPMSREVCNNPQSITQTDGAVFFTSDKGLMVVVGSQVKCVSEQLSGRRDLFAESQLQGINLINNYHSFFKNCFIAYDYRDSLLWIYRKNHPACLIYSIKNSTFSKSWFLLVQNAVNYYPDYLLQDNSKKVYSLLQRPAITDDLYTGYGSTMITRPMKFENGLALKSLLDIRSIRRVNGKMTLRVFASNNLDDWVELTSLRGTPWLYYRFRYDFKNMKAVDRFAGSVVITQERRTNKLRTPGSIIEQEGSDYTYYIRTNWDDGIQIPQDQSVLTILFDAFFTRKAAGADEEEPAVVKYKIWKVSQSETYEELYSGEDTEATSKPIEVAYSETPASNTSKIVIAINIEQDPTPSSYLAMAQVNVTKIPDTPTVYTYIVVPSPSSIVIPYGETEVEAIVRGYAKRSADGGEPEDFPAYFRVWKRSGDTYTQIGQSPSAGYSYGVDDFFDTNDDAVVISIFKETPSDDPGDILASAIIPITEEPAPPEPPTPPTPTEDFDTLLDGFNDVLESCGFSRITQSSAPNTYAYLESGYDMAIDEWEDADSDLFKTTTYPELYDGTDYRGSNTDYNGVAKNSMTSWLMAMQLAELVPSEAASGTFTNNQTEIYKYAYNCVAPNNDGKSIPLYGGFDIHSDPMIARLAAGAVYQNVRGAKTFAQINALRQEVYGDNGDHWIDAYDWDGLGYTYYDDRDVVPNVLGETARLTYQSGMTGLGYAVNTDAFLPGAPGPFVKDNASDWIGLLTQTPGHLVDKKTGATTPAGQPDALFNATTKNYLVDENIDAFIVQNYNLGKATPSSEWNDPDYTDTMKNVVIDAAAADSCTDRYFYGDRIDVECTITTQVVDSTTQYIYSFAEGGLGNLYIEGPLSLLKDVYQQGDTLEDGYTTAPGVIHTFLSDVMKMFDNSRYPTFHNRFGRRRPCVGETRYCPRVWTGVINNSYSKQNAIYIPTLSVLIADSAAAASKYASNDELVEEQPKSYPSGHSAQAWGMSMLIGQILPDRIAELMAKAYKVGVGRTVSRYHWNSDAIYGRLFATMMMPLVNAMNGTNPNNGETFQDSYDTLRSALSIGGDINISVTISNTTGSAITLKGQLVFVLVNPDRNGVYHGWHGVYNRTDRISFSSQAVTIQPGDSRTFTNVFCEGIGGRSLLPGERMGETDYATNVLLYDTNDVSSTIIPNNMSSSFYFEDGGSYAITITGYNPNP